jgi:hypothetical protein
MNEPEAEPSGNAARSDLCGGRPEPKGKGCPYRDRMLASLSFSRVLVDGDEVFRERLVQAAAAFEVDVTFADPELEARRQRLQRQHSQVRPTAGKRVRERKLCAASVHFASRSRHDTARVALGGFGTSAVAALHIRALFLCQRVSDGPAFQPRSLQALALFATTNASSWSNVSDMSPDVEPDSMAASSVSFEG